YPARGNTQETSSGSGNARDQARQESSEKARKYTAVTDSQQTPADDVRSAGIKSELLNPLNYLAGISAYGLEARYRFSNSSRVQSVFTSVIRSTARMPSRWSISC